MTIMRIIGTTKISTQNTITIVGSVAGLLNINPGDVLAFLKNTSGDIVIKKLADIEMKDSEEQT